jgi:DNA-binding NtrC family response regulator
LTTHALPHTAIGSVAPIAGYRAAGGFGAEVGASDCQLSVLICDDRVDVRQELSLAFQLRSQGPVESVGDNAALLDLYETRSPIQVMIGVHPGSTFGLDALVMLLARHPAALPVVYGARSDIELLASVYARGAAGLVLWEIGTP